MKKSIIICIALILLFSINCISYAGVGDIISIEDVTPSELEGVQANKILGLMQWLGYAIAIGMIIFCGIKYVLSGATQKAKIKDTLIPLLIGAILIACATTITSAAFNIFSNSSNSSVVTEQAK